MAGARHRRGVPVAGGQIQGRTDRPRRVGDEHPQDAATVKELYGAGVDTIIGYAVSRKTAPTSEGGATWYWYERVNDTTYGGDLGVGLCTGCHGGGADYILTPFPLQ